jgi:hypothetical protein
LHALSQSFTEHRPTPIDLAQAGVAAAFGDGGQAIDPLDFVELPGESIGMRVSMLTPASVRSLLTNVTASCSRRKYFCTIELFAVCPRDSLRTARYFSVLSVQRLRQRFATVGTQVCHQGVLGLATHLGHAGGGKPLAVSILGVALHLAEGAVPGDRHQLLSGVSGLGKEHRHAELVPTPPQSRRQAA